MLTAHKLSQGLCRIIPTRAAFYVKKQVPSSITEAEIKTENEFLSKKVTDKRELTYLKAMRVAALDMFKDDATNDDHWWVRIKRMDEDDFDFMPAGFQNKYGTIVANLEEHVA